MSEWINWKNKVNILNEDLFRFCVIVNKPRERKEIGRHQFSFKLPFHVYGRYKWINNLQLLAKRRKHFSQTFVDVVHFCEIYRLQLSVRFGEGRRQKKRRQNNKDTHINVSLDLCLLCRRIFFLLAFFTDFFEWIMTEEVNSFSFKWVFFEKGSDYMAWIIQCICKAIKINSNGLKNENLFFFQFPPLVEIFLWKFNLFY